MLSRTRCRRRIQR